MDAAKLAIWAEFMTLVGRVDHRPGGRRCEDFGRIGKIPTMDRPQAGASNGPNIALYSSYIVRQR
ncbi:hypothetical protein [Caulobacter soli]|uniref:hypothetical protein n=1 Tax=Caulobacter soli TaxID=2708539 RepID=UPI0013EAA936|nr:hypothetical protein [Caulobacter soli]